MESMFWNVVLVCWILHVVLTTGCQDLDPQACIQQAQTNPGICQDPSFSQTACPKFCNMCPLQCYECRTTDPTFQNCTTQKTCANGEICLHEMKSTGLSAEYTLGCATVQVCDGQAIVVGRRSQTIATEHRVHERDTTIRCCSSHLCNVLASTTTMPSTSKTTTRTMTSAVTTTPIVTRKCDVSNGYKALTDNHGNTPLCVKVHNEPGFFGLGLKSWEDARKACRQESGDLVALDSLQKLNLIQSELTSLRLEGNAILWIGAHDSSFNHDFHWVNGHPVDMKHGWGFGEPESNSQHCVSIHHVDGYKLHDNVCALHHNFICERM